MANFPLVVGNKQTSVSGLLIWRCVSTNQLIGLLKEPPVLQVI